jgi:dienelactone hydrolase
MKTLLSSLIAMLTLLSACNSETKKEAPSTIIKEEAAVAIMEKFPVGEIIEKVRYRNDTTLSYCLYLPKDYNTEKKYPVVYAFDPHSTGKLPVSKYKELAEKYGYILVGSNNSQNGNAWELSKALANNMFSDSKSRISIDPNRVYLLGFSGGARIANAVTLSDNSINGVICCGAANPAALPGFERNNYTFMGIAGNTDFNYAEVKRYELLDLAPKRIKHTVITFDGKHEWPPLNTMEEAFLWLQLNDMRKNAALKNDSLVNKNVAEERKKLDAFVKADKDYEAYEVCKRTLNYYEGLADLTHFFDAFKTLQTSESVDKQLKKNELDWTREEKLKEEFLNNFQVHDFPWWQNEVASLNQQIKSSKDKEDALIKQRLLGYLSLVCYMQTNGALKENNLQAAEYFDKMYVLVDPTNSEAYYFNAEIKAKQGNKDAALKALEDAVKNGFEDKGRMERDSAFTGMKDKKEFNNILAKIK